MAMVRRNMCGVIFCAGISVSPLYSRPALTAAISSLIASILRKTVSGKSWRTGPKARRSWAEMAVAVSMARATGSVIHQCLTGWSGSALCLVERIAGVL